VADAYKAAKANGHKLEQPVRFRKHAAQPYDDRIFGNADLIDTGQKKHTNHAISKEIVASAERSRCAIALEDLTHSQADEG
jgi:hypothetical protein